MQTTPGFIIRLYEKQNGNDIPKKDRGWFWKTFKELKKSGVQYKKAWYFTTLALENHYETQK